jgi:hypothetical protein
VKMQEQSRQAIEGKGSRFRQAPWPGQPCQTTQKLGTGSSMAMPQKRKCRNKGRQTIEGQRIGISAGAVTWTAVPDDTKNWGRGPAWLATETKMQEQSRQLIENKGEARSAACRPQPKADSSLRYAPLRMTVIPSVASDLVSSRLAKNLTNSRTAVNRDV